MMNQKPYLLDTINLIIELFHNRTDKIKEPYVNHCIRVYSSLFHPETPDDVLHAALLHDVFEDIPEWTAYRLGNEGYSEYTIQLVEALTKPKSVHYQTWIQKIADSQDPWLIRIKLADIEDNLDPRRVSRLPKRYQSLVPRYEKARITLTQALESLSCPQSSPEPQAA